MYNTEEIERGVKHIAFQLGLPIQIHLVYGEKNIQSAGLARTDAAGHGIEGVIAQVDIPQYLPKYGSKMRPQPADPKNQVLITSMEGHQRPRPAVR